MKEYIEFLFGEEFHHKISELKKGEKIDFPNCEKEGHEVRIQSTQIEITKDSDEKLLIKINKVNITLLKAVDAKTLNFIKTLMSVPHHLCIEIESLSILTSEELPKEKQRIPFARVVDTSTVQTGPFGNSYPPEDEWALVFGCPFYQAFPSLKALPIVVLEGEVQVALKDKKSQTYRTFLLPLYIVFYETQNSSKATDSIFLSGAKIEVDSPHQFSLIKSNDKYSLSFNSVQLMQQWSQATLCMINEASSSLEKWRKENC